MVSLIILLFEMARENNEEDAKKDYIKRQKANHDAEKCCYGKGCIPIQWKKRVTR